MNFNDFPPHSLDVMLRHLACEISYESFVKRLYQDIDKVISMIIDQSETYLNSTEPQITGAIHMGLRCKEYDAQLDADRNGNADISVVYKSYKWIAEAKFSDGGNTYLYKGFTQLVERYSKGEANADSGGMLIYIKPIKKGQNEAKTIQAWRDYLLATNAPLGQPITCTTCALKHSNFISTHSHTTTGYNYSVRHMPVTLHHIPRDGSANKYKAKIATYDNDG